jgi:hypothetical protein
MSRMILTDGAWRRLPLSKRIVDENLGGYRHVLESCHRRSSATGAASLAPRSAGHAQESRNPDAGGVKNDAECLDGAEREEEIVDAAWLLAWSNTVMRPSDRAAERTVRRGGVSSFGARRR